MRATKASLEALYRRYNRRAFVHPDPVELLWAFDDPLDREVAALVASSLAYGRVAQILKSAGSVLERMGRPAAFLRGSTPAGLRRAFSGFRHRFAGGGELAALLSAAARALRSHGTLEAAFARGVAPGDGDVWPALEAFGRLLEAHGAGPCGHLLARPARGGACKRLNLMLRWLVRRDAVDPGGWTCVSPARLLVPLDTHMHRVALSLGLTRRRTTNRATVREITASLARFAPRDPVRYDFALTRPGILGHAR